MKFSIINLGYTAFFIALFFANNCYSGTALPNETLLQPDSLEVKTALEKTFIENEEFALEKQRIIEESLELRKEQAKLRAEQVKARAEQAKARAEQSKERAIQAKVRAVQAKARAERMKARVENHRAFIKESLEGDAEIEAYNSGINSRTSEMKELNGEALKNPSDFFGEIEPETKKIEEYNRQLADGSISDDEPITDNNAKTSANPIDKLIKKYNGADGFTIVNINEDMLDLFPKDGGSSDGVNEIMDGLKGIKIITYSPDEVEKNKRIDFYGEVVRTVPLDEYKEIMTVDEKDSKVRFLVKKNKNKIGEFIMLTLSDGETTLIWMSGNIDLNNLTKITKGLNLDEIMKGKNSGDDDKPKSKKGQK